MAIFNHSWFLKLNLDCPIELNILTKFKSFATKSQAEAQEMILRLFTMACFLKVWKITSSIIGLLVYRQAEFFSVLEGRFQNCWTKFGSRSFGSASV